MTVAAVGRSRGLPLPRKRHALVLERSAKRKAEKRLERVPNTPAVSGTSGEKNSP